MSNIIQNIIGLFSRTNIKAELVSLQTQYLELKNKHDLTQALVAELVKEAKECSDSIGTINDTIETQCQDWIDNNIDDRISDYIEGYDYSDIISDELRNHDFVSEDDLSNAVETALQDIDLDVDAPVRKAMEQEVCEDWFGEAVEVEIKKAVAKFSQLENNQNISAIDESIKHSIESLVVERMEAKFGEGWDNWFAEHTRFCVKSVLADFLQSAYEQTKQENK